ncbi:13139_t:CDS:2, partial [Cetraspora pellucida]
MQFGHEPDEIKQYLDARYISAPEAAWRLFGMRLYEEVRNIVRLALHIPGMHQVVFDPEDEAAEILSCAYHKKTTLTEFFETCASSFDHLRVVNDIQYSTFKSACIALGLLENDGEWNQCLEEASVMHSGSQLRALFAVILTQ